ncbi:AMP-binding protein, partial [Reinekea sp.]
MKSYYSLTQILQMNAEAYPSEIALRQKKHGIWQQQTWQDFLTVTASIAAGLIELDGERGCHIGIIAENCEDWVLAQLGVNFMGGVVCGVYPTSPSNEVVYLLKSADCTMVFCEDQEQVDKVLMIEDQLPLLKHIIVFDPKGLDKYDHPKLITLKELQASGYQALQRKPDCVNERHDQQVADDTALIVFTSGSTGLPKAAMISYHNIWHEMLVIRDAIETEPGMNLLSYLP